MIAAVAPNMSFDKLPIGWFDVAAVVILGFGMWRGRKNGMTKEMMPLLQSLVLVIVCGLGYPIVAKPLANVMGLSKTASFIWGYLILAFGVFLIFSLFKRLVMHKMEGSSFFGSNEYYMGMVSGLIRYSAFLLFGLALLNAPFYSAVEIQARQIYVQRWYGANYFPGLQDIQQGVFKSSFIGPRIKDYLGVLLINSVPPGKTRAASPAVLLARR